MAESVVTSAEPFFLKALSIIGDRKNDHTGDLPFLQQELSGELQRIEQKVHSGELNVSGAEWQSLKEALLFWVDEILTSHFPDWQNYTLEHELYRSRNRAWKFYVEGEKYLVAGTEDAAEIFYLAVALGFEGDIEGAFLRSMRKPMPGNTKVPKEARIAWARQLQGRLRQQQNRDLQEQRLEGDSGPIDGNTTLTYASAAFTIMTLCFLVLLSWHFFRS